MYIPLCKYMYMSKPYTVYRIAGFIGRNGGLLVNRRKLGLVDKPLAAIVTPSQGVYAVGALVADVILAV